MVPWPLMTITSVPGRPLLHALQDRQAIAVGQQQVEQDDFGPPLVEDGLADPAEAGRADLEGRLHRGLLDHHAEPVDGDRVVVDDQHATPAKRGPSHAASHYSPAGPRRRRPPAGPAAPLRYNRRHGRPAPAAADHAGDLGAEGGAGPRRRRADGLRTLRRRDVPHATRSGAARPAASRPTAAAGSRGRRPRRPMDVLESQVRTSSDAFVRNHARMAGLVAEYRQRLAAVRDGGGAAATERHRSLGKLPVRERLDLLLDPGSPFLELSPLAAWDLYDQRRPGGGPGHRHRPRLGARGPGRRQRRHRQGRHLLPAHRQEARARAGRGAAEPPALRLPGGLGRRVPAAPGRGLPRPRSLRPHLLQPGADVGGRAGADRGGDGLVHGRRRLRAGDVRRDHHRQGHRHHLPGRAAAREGRHRRVGHRRGTGRRRRAHPRVGRRRLLRRGRSPRAAPGPHRGRVAAPGQAG